jgi:hypothetical protein
MPSIVIIQPFPKWGGIAQLVERLVRNEKARGSNPLTSTLVDRYKVLVISGIEKRAFNLILSHLT